MVLCRIGRSISSHGVMNSLFHRQFNTIALTNNCVSSLCKVAFIQRRFWQSDGGKSYIPDIIKNASALIDEAKEFQRVGNRIKAMEIYRKSLDMDTSFDGHYNYGRCIMEQADAEYDKAVEMVKNGEDVDPDIFDDVNDAWKQSVHQFELAGTMAKEFSELRDACLNRGIAMVHCDTKNAVEALEEVLTLTVQENDLMHLSRINNLDKDDEAWRALRADEILCTHNLGLALAANEDYVTALEVFNTARDAAIDLGQGYPDEHIVYTKQIMKEAKMNGTLKETPRRTPKTLRSRYKVI